MINEAFHFFKLAIKPALSIINSGYRFIKHVKFSRIFGKIDWDCPNQYYLVCSRLHFRNDLFNENSEKIGLPLVKHDVGFRISDVAHGTEIKACNYIAQEFGRRGLSSITFSMDEDLKTSFNINYISFGCFSNDKTIEIMNNSSDCLLKMSLTNNIVSIIARNDNSKLFQCDSSHDYGLILKISPAEAPEKTWMACLGINETGTSGAAYFLSNRWKEIYKKLNWQTKLFLKKPENFAAVIKVRPGCDETAQLIAVVTETSDVDKITSSTTQTNFFTIPPSASRC